MNYFNGFKDGIWQKNPVLVLNLGLCPALAVTTSAVNALWMALSVTAVLLISNIMVSMLRNITPSSIRIPVFIIIIASIVSAGEMLLNAFLPEVYSSLGIFLPLITVNCIILGRAEEFASRNGIIASALDALGVGAGFALILFCVGTVREVSGANTFFGHTVINGMRPSSMMVMAPGAFFAIGIILWAMNAVNSGKKV